MKSEQDSLERRLWAKQERLKSEHEKSLQAEKDMWVWLGLRQTLDTTEM